MAKTKIPARACIVQLADDPDAGLEVDTTEEGKARFRMVANSGAVMKHWWFDQLAIDLSGIQIPEGDLPALLDHDVTQRVGWADKVGVEKGELVAEGVIMQASEAGRQVLEEAREGYPWQASVRVPPLVIERVAAGEKAQVNGRTMIGPGTIFRKSVLEEVTFTALGMDAATHANLLSKGDGAEIEVEVLNPKGTAMSEENTETTTTPAAGEPGPIQLSAEPPKLTPAREAPSQEVILQVQTAERDRIAGIMKLASPGQEELRDKLIADGAEKGDAAQQLLSHLRENTHLLHDKGAHLSQMRAGATPAVGGAEIEDEPDAVGDEPLKGVNPRTQVELAKKNLGQFWDENPDTHSQFSSKESFVAYRLHAARGNITVNGKVVAN